jgi:hypothetical protein
VNFAGVIAIIIVLGCIIASYAIWPYGPCPSCKGRRGRGPGSTRRAWSQCKRCGGRGEQVRFVSGLIRPDLVKDRDDSSR